MSRFLTVLALLLLAPAAHAGGPSGLVPNGYSDHTASRIDTEVFGWNRDFTQVAAVAVNVNRNVRGGQRGQVLLVVWGVNSLRPLENVEINIISAAELPHDPVKLDEAKDKLGDIDYNLGHQWPRRPKKTRPDGWMTVETIWDPIQTGRDCQPAVSFVLTKGGETRFQAPQIVSDIKADCSQLRMTHVRTYWARPDLAVAMPKFEWSPSENEMSFRQPVSASWDRARPLHFLVRSATPRDARTQRAIDTLSAYGEVRVEPAQKSAASGIAYSNDMNVLGLRLANRLALLRTGTGAGNADIVVTIGGDDPDKPLRYGSRK